MPLHNFQSWVSIKSILNQSLLWCMERNSRWDFWASWGDIFSFFASHFSRSLSKCRNNISITINSQGCKDQIPKIVIMKIPMHHELPSNIVVIADHVANSSLPAELSRVHWDSVWILPCPRKMPKFTSLDALSLNVPLGCKFSVRDRDT